MGTTTRQRAWRKLREAKRVLQTALEGGYLSMQEDPGALRQQAQAILAGEYPCNVKLTVVAGWADAPNQFTLALEGWYDTPAGLRVMLKSLNVKTWEAL